jgi:hypothetical protein
MLAFIAPIVSSAQKKVFADSQNDVRSLMQELFLFNQLASTESTLNSNQAGNFN